MQHWRPLAGEFSAKLNQDLVKIRGKLIFLLAKNTGLNFQLIDMEAQLHDAIKDQSASIQSGIEKSFAKLRKT